MKMVLLALSLLGTHLQLLNEFGFTTDQTHKDVLEMWLSDQAGNPMLLMSSPRGKIPRF
jgi:hypothetical protein